jgi:hypothetical protein
MVELHSLSRSCGGGLGWGCRRESHCPSGEYSPNPYRIFQMRYDLPRKRER